MSVGLVMNASYPVALPALDSRQPISADLPHGDRATCRYTAERATEGGEVGDYTRKVEGAASAVLREDERLLAAVRIEPLGATLPDDSPAPPLAATFPTRHAMIVALSDQRLMVFDRTTMLGRPRNLIAEFARADVQMLWGERGSIQHLFTITFTDASRMELAVAGVDRFERLIEAWGFPLDARRDEAA